MQYPFASENIPATPHSPLPTPYSLLPTPYSYSLLPTRPKAPTPIPIRAAGSFYREHGTIRHFLILTDNRSEIGAQNGKYKLKKQAAEVFQTSAALFGEVLLLRIVAPRLCLSQLCCYRQSVNLDGFAAPPVGFVGSCGQWIIPSALFVAALLVFCSFICCPHSMNFGGFPIFFENIGLIRRIDFARLHPTGRTPLSPAST